MGESKKATRNSELIISTLRTQFSSSTSLKSIFRWPDLSLLLHIRPWQRTTVRCAQRPRCRAAPRLDSPLRASPLVLGHPFLHRLRATCRPSHHIIANHLPDLQSLHVVLFWRILYEFFPRYVHEMKRRHTFRSAHQATVSVSGNQSSKLST